MAHRASSGPSSNNGSPSAQDGEDDTDEPSCTQQDKALGEPSAAEAIHQREVKMREKFMLKNNASELFGKTEQSARVSLSFNGRRSEAIRHRALSCVVQPCQAKTYIVHPQGTFRTWWDLCSVFLVCWIAIYLPFRLAFAPANSAAVNTIDLIADIFFMADILLNMITAYFDDGQLVVSHKLILRNYARTWFAFDLISSFPFDWLVVFPPNLSELGEEGLAETATGSASLIKIVRIVKLLRLFRIARIFRVFSRFDEGLPWISQIFASISSNLMRIIKICVGMFVFCHWNGCFQFMLAQLDSPPYNATSGWPADFPNGFHKHSWVTELGIEDSPPFMQWEWAFFVSIAQMLSLTHSVTQLRRSIEMWGYLMSILIGAVFYAIFVAVLTAVMADIDTSHRAYQHRLDSINQYMIHSQLPRELRAKIRTYYQIYFPLKRAFDEEHILGQVSRPLRQEVCLHNCRSVLAALQLLDDGKHKGEKGLPGAISQELQRCVFVTGDYIIREGEETEGLFFISAGLVELFNDAEPDQVLTTLGSGSMFGEMALLSQSGRAVASVRVKTFCEGYHLSKASFNRLTMVYPSFKEYLESVARLRLQRSNKQALGKNEDVQSMIEHVSKTGQGGGAASKKVDRKTSLLTPFRHPARRAEGAVNKLGNILRTSKETESEYAQGLKQMGYEIPTHSPKTTSRVTATFAKITTRGQRTSVRTLQTVAEERSNEKSDSSHRDAAPSSTTTLEA